MPKLNGIILAAGIAVGAAAVIAVKVDSADAAIKSWTVQVDDTAGVVIKSFKGYRTADGTSRINICVQATKVDGGTTELTGGDCKECTGPLTVATFTSCLSDIKTASFK